MLLGWIFKLETGNKDEIGRGVVVSKVSLTRPSRRGGLVKLIPIRPTSARMSTAAR